MDAIGPLSEAGAENQEQALKLRLGQVYGLGGDHNRLTEFVMNDPAGLRLGYAD